VKDLGGELFASIIIGVVILSAVFVGIHEDRIDALENRLELKAVMDEAYHLSDILPAPAGTGVCQKMRINTVFVTPDTVYVTDTIHDTIIGHSSFLAIDTSLIKYAGRSGDWLLFNGDDRDVSERFNKSDEPLILPDTIYVTDTVVKRINIEDVLDGTGGPKWNHLDITCDTTSIIAPDGSVYAIYLEPSYWHSIGYGKYIHCDTVWR
jgi:hypothetical protein